MRRLIPLGLLIGIFAGCDSSTVPDPAKQPTLVVRELNRMCEFSYCEGTFKFRFRNMECVETECTVNFSATRHEGTEETPIEGSVVISDLNAGDLIVVEQGRRYVSEVLLDKLDEAMEDWERANGS